MLFLINLLLVLISVCAFAAPTSDPTETKTGFKILDLARLSKAKVGKDNKLPVVIQPVYGYVPEAVPEIVPEEKPANETKEVVRPTWACTYQVNYKMNTYYLFGDNWNATKDTIKATCENRPSRLLNHWSYREWTDDDGSHFCAKVSLFRGFPVFCFGCKRGSSEWRLTFFPPSSSTFPSPRKKNWRTGLTRSSPRKVGALESTAKMRRRMALLRDMVTARQLIAGCLRFV
jgi:hypothetical protein